MRPASRVLIAAALTMATTSLALAQTAPPIKPGLWEAQIDRGAGAAPMPDMSEQFKNLPPEARKQVEAMMKERGVDLSAGPGKLRICLDKASLDQGRWQGEQHGCKTDFINRSAMNWKWRSVCGEPQRSETTGEATFTSAESYTVKTSTTTTINGQPQTMQNTLRSKWVGADCGDVKPVQNLNAQAVPKAK